MFSIHYASKLTVHILFISSLNPTWASVDHKHLILYTGSSWMFGNEQYHYSNINYIKWICGILFFVFEIIYNDRSTINNAKFTAVMRFFTKNKFQNNTLLSLLEIDNRMFRVPFKTYYRITRVYYNIHLSSKKIFYQIKKVLWRCKLQRYYKSHLTFKLTYLIKMSAYYYKHIQSQCISNNYTILL